MNRYKVPLVDLKAQYLSIRDEIDAAVSRCLSSGQYVLGEQVEAFEEEAANYLGAKYAVGVSSGTDALYLGVRAALEAKLLKKAIISTTPFTFVATAEAIRRNGCIVKFVDVDQDTLIAPSDLVVHLYGYPVAGGLIEDCAQAFGASLDGQKVGTRGLCGCYSFFPTKVLGCYGDGGLVATNYKPLADRVRLLRNHADLGRYVYKEHGVNSRLDALQAAVLRVKLRHVDQWIESRGLISEWYTSGLWNTGVEMPVDSMGHAYNYYTVQIRAKELRDSLKAYLAEKGVETQIYYPVPLHLQAAYANLGYHRGDLPNAEWAADHVLSLPMYPELTEGQVEYVIKSVKEGIRDHEDRGNRRVGVRRESHRQGTEGQRVQRTEL